MSTTLRMNTPTAEELNAWLELMMIPATEKEAEFDRLDDVDALVAKEATRLDRLFPGWAHRVNIDTLDIASGRNCILAQAAYRKRLFRRQPIGFGQADDLVRRDADAEGAKSYAPAYYSNRTRDAWINEIRRRYA